MQSTQTGYEPATGLGSPKAEALATDLGDATPPPPLPVSLAKPVKASGHGHSHPNIERPNGSSNGSSAYPGREQPNFDRQTNPALRNAGAPAAAGTSETADTLITGPGGSTAVNAAIFSRSAPAAIGSTGLSLAAAVRDSALLSNSAGAAIFEEAAATLRAAASRAAPIAQAAAKEIASAIEAPAAAANVVTHFIHVNALTAFCDATAAFINECATVPTSSAAATGPHRTRAWLITAGVLAVDALLVAHWYATRPKKEDEQEQGGEAATLRFPFFNGDPLPDSRCG